MKANPGKCHLLLSTKSPEVASTDGIQITSSNIETLLGITIDLGITITIVLGGLSIICPQKNAVL